MTDASRASLSESFQDCIDALEIDAQWLFMVNYGDVADELGMAISHLQVAIRMITAPEEE